MATSTTTATPDHQLYHEYTVAEDQERTNVHYEQPPEFFYIFTGGEWNVYSCNIWDGATTDTESQEAKLDMTASLAGLKPGMRILDVGCGWAGPLTYLCKKYGVSGVGLTLSPTQKTAADERIARHGVDAEVKICHWQDYEDDRPFDAILTDEVIVHFFDLGGFFKRCHQLLAPEGVMVNKELHLSHPRHAVLERGGEFVSKIYGDTGNYRLLSEELALANEAGFDVSVHHIPRRHYETTIDHWLSNMYEKRDRVKELLGDEGYRNWRIYLKLARRIQRNMTLDYVVGRKFVPPS
ncbi:MAG: cyclopropane-fatty-acyl-phospholipid synthase [Chloroflexota bacterium]|jgi:cyclopropane-fatty-acyl-phospholipid synthase|nr:cyclopropane-fatty-acyl-phospholipid synthase [Chloroflexota bacterium]